MFGYFGYAYPVPGYPGTAGNSYNDLASTRHSQYPGTAVPGCRDFSYHYNVPPVEVLTLTVTLTLTLTGKPMIRNRMPRRDRNSYPGYRNSYPGTRYTVVADRIQLYPGTRVLNTAIAMLKLARLPQASVTNAHPEAE
eukprot:3172599-Rhodomonas_salina.3